MRGNLLIIIVAIVILGGFFGYILWRPLYLFTETLHVGETEDEGDGMYVIQLFDQKGGEVAHIAFITGMVTSPIQNLTSLRVSIWHKDGTHLDSLQLAFTPSILHYPFHVYLETPPGGQWNVLTETSGDKHVFSVPELGFYGAGTVTLNFLIRQWAALLHTTITIQITLHETTFPIIFTRHQATATLIL